MTKNMHVDAPTNMRAPKYGEHFCLILKDGQYVGALYLDQKMRKIWRSNKFSVVMTDI